MEKKTTKQQKILAVILLLIIVFSFGFLIKTEGFETLSTEGKYCVKFDLIKYDLAREDALINCFNVVTGEFKCTWAINDSKGIISIWDITNENGVPEYIPSSRIDYNCTEYVVTEKVIFPEEDIVPPVWDGPEETYLDNLSLN